MSPIIQESLLFYLQMYFIKSLFLHFFLRWTRKVMLANAELLIRNDIQFEIWDFIWMKIIESSSGFLGYLQILVSRRWLERLLGIQWSQRLDQPGLIGVIALSVLESYLRRPVSELCSNLFWQRVWMINSSFCEFSICRSECWAIAELRRVLISCCCHLFCAWNPQYRLLTVVVVLVMSRLGLAQRWDGRALLLVDHACNVAIAFFL